MTEKKQEVFVDLTQDDDDEKWETTNYEHLEALKAPSEDDSSDCQETVTFSKKTRRYPNEKISATFDCDNAESDSSDCILILSPLKSLPAKTKEATHKTTCETLGVESDDDSDDLGLLLSRPAFASSAAAASHSDGRNIASFSSQASIYNETRRSYEVGASIDSNSNSKNGSKDAGSPNFKMTEKERKKQQKDAEKERRAQEKEKVKRQQESEKQQKLLEKKRLMEEKQQQKEHDKSERQKSLLEDQQDQGKFAKQEICLHLEQSLAESVLGGLIYIDLSDTYMVSAPNNNATALTTTEVSPPPQITDGCIIWSRRDYLLGGASAAFDPTGEDGVEWLDIVAVVFYDPKVFLRLLTRDIIVGVDDDEDVPDDFPLLRSWVKNLRESYARARLGSSTPRILLILHKVQEEMSQQWVKNNGRKKRRKSFIPTNEDELHDAIIWMLIEERIECSFTTTDQETIEYIKGLTRALSESPYTEQMTELQCIKKLKSTHSMITDDNRAMTPYDRAKDSWLRMLQQIKGLTEGMALRVVRHYPTVRSLMNMYEDPALTTDQKRALLATLLKDGRRNMVKISDSVYRLMTSEDPTELIL
mmetsp:Transcript_4691/g.6955  ORF Transcript_4691/g.6955 Transcript_4691/m.6955 type:complete len:590 (-) Transcript_4691:143-1912(-)